MKDKLTTNHRVALCKRAAILGLALVLLLSLIVSAAGQAGVAAAATPTTLVFQDNVSPDAAYQGVADTYLSLYEPNTAYGTAATMRINPNVGGRERGLIKFDITRIPTNATVLEATMHLYAWYWSQPFSLNITAYQVKTHWNEFTATWNRATASEFWNAPGCGDPTFDYDGFSGVTRVVTTNRDFYEWNLTSMAQQWVSSPVSNEGVVLIADGLSVQYQFRPSEISSYSVRPYLVVTYIAEVQTPTPTRTATRSATPTRTSSPTATATSQYSPTPTRTATVTPTATRVPTSTPIPPPERRLFQQGRFPTEEYQGASDTYISLYRPDANWGSQDTLLINGRDGGSERALLRFDLAGDIPTGAHVLSAKLSLYAWSRRTLFGMRVAAYPVVRDWGEHSATWNQASEHNPWDVAGCAGIGGDRLEDWVTSRFVYFTNRFYEWDLTPLVQRWVDNPGANDGVLLFGLGVDQELRFRSAEWLVADQRPFLAVAFVAP